VQGPGFDPHNAKKYPKIKYYLSLAVMGICWLGFIGLIFKNGKGAGARVLKINRVKTSKSSPTHK
jgi:hypothetical protein